MWFDSCVGNKTCCFKEKQSKRARKGASDVGIGESTWKLKSPVINNSEGREIRLSKSVQNSERKVVLEADGGQ